MNRHSSFLLQLRPATHFSPAFLIMQQSLSIFFFETLIIIPIILASPLQQQFYSTSQTSDIHNEYPPNKDPESSHYSSDVAIDSSVSNPVFIANNLWMDWLRGKFLLPSPPSWTGDDSSIAPEFTCDRFAPYCCTGKYIRRKGWALGPCFPCLYHTYSPSANLHESILIKVVHR